MWRQHQISRALFLLVETLWRFRSSLFRSRALRRPESGRLSSCRNNFFHRLSTLRHRHPELGRLRSSCLPPHPPSPVGHPTEPAPVSADSRSKRCRSSSACSARSSRNWHCCSRRAARADQSPSRRSRLRSLLQRALWVIRSRRFRESQWILFGRPGVRDEGGRPVEQHVELSAVAWGRDVEAADLERALSHRCWRRMQSCVPYVSGGWGFSRGFAARRGQPGAGRFYDRNHRRPGRDSWSCGWRRGTEGAVQKLRYMTASMALKNSHVPQ